MATRPTFLPYWATTGEKLKPPSGKQDVGYSPGEEPGAQWDNYREDLQRQWIEYLRDERDALVAADEGDLHGQAWFDVDSLNSARVSAGAPTLGSAERWTIPQAAAIQCRLPVTAGEDLQKITVRGTDAADGTISLTLFSVKDGGTTTLAGPTGSDNSGTAQDVTIDLTGIEETPADGATSFVLQIRNSFLGGSDVVVDKVRTRKNRASNPS
jgi:hypothetical protein